MPSEIVAAARGGRAASTPSSRTAASSLASAASGASIESGRDRRAHQPPLRLLHRAAFRRLPRGDGPRPAARHGDPHLRCRALHGRHGRRPPSIATKAIRAAPGTGTARRPTRSSSSPTASSSPIAAPGAPRARNTSWESAWRIVGTRGTLLWDGDDASRRASPTERASRVRVLRVAEPVAVPPLDARRPDRRPCQRHRAISSPPSRAAAEPETRRRRQYQEPRHGVRRDRERRDRPPRRDRHRHAQEAQCSMSDALRDHPHRHHDPRQRPGPGRLCEADLPHRLRELRAVLLADHRQQGPPAARQASCSRPSATATSPSRRSACSAIRSRTPRSTARRCTAGRR